MIFLPQQKFYYMPESDQIQEPEPKPREESTNPNGQLMQTARVFYRAVRMWFKDLINLEEGMDQEGTVISIKSGKMMRGANAWLLMCSIMVASLGLDLNSAAVIIGAMLISPLMSPILGIGLAVGINDREALFIAVRQFSISIIIALITSTLYFLITPLGEITPEIKGRTAPTFLDGLVAVFGGLAGIISASRKDKSNAIPGVAIATALMPPLCVTGFGIATGNWQVMLNSFYLFFLNSFFIALTTFLIIRLLRFPLKEKLEEKEGRRTRNIIIAFSLIIIVPSIIILTDIWKQRQETRKVETFVADHFGRNAPTSCVGYTLLSQDSTKNKVLVLQLLGKFIPNDSISFYEKELRGKGLDSIRISLIQGTATNLEQINRMQLQLSSMGQLVNKLEESKVVQMEQDQAISELNKRVEILHKDSSLFIDLSKEVKTLFPNVDEMRFARMQKTNFQDTTLQMPTYLVHWKSSRLQKAEQQKLYDFLKVRAKLDTLELIAY